MLKPIKRTEFRKTKSRFAIVASRYNDCYVAAMVRAALGVLRQAGATTTVIRVPGAYEIPVVASRLARAASSQNPNLAGIICLGVILRGETTHAAHIGEAVTQALMRLQVDHGLPVVHEVLLLENEDQARVRCLGGTHNRGAEAAQTALAMAQVMARL